MIYPQLFFILIVLVLSILMMDSAEASIWWKIHPWWFWQRYWALKILKWG